MKNGIKIMSLQAAEINEYRAGIRKTYRKNESVLSNSLLLNKLKEFKINIKNDKTVDVVNLKFDFGSLSAEEEINRLNKAILDTTDTSKIEFLETLKANVKANKDLYVKKSVDTLRKEFYENGFSLQFKEYKQLKRNSKCYNKELANELKEIKSLKDKKDKTEKLENFYRKLDTDKDTVTTTINYKMLFRSPAKARVGEVIFINEKFYDKVHNWMCMDLKLPEIGAKIVEMSAYSSLVSSSIENEIKIDVDSILILNDLDSICKKNVKVVSVKDDKCVVDTVKTNVKNTIFDGMGLIDSSLMEENYKENGMLLLRQHFFKACLFNTNIQVFFKDYCKENNLDYNTYTVKDMFNVKHKVKDIKVITTDNAIKWLKFKDLMGKTDKEAYEYWKNKVKEENDLFGICKTDHKSKLNIDGQVVQQMSYQMLNTLNCDMKNVAETSINYVNELKENNDLFADFLEQNKNYSNKNEMMLALYKHNKEIAETDLYRGWKSDILTQYKSKLKRGKIVLNGDNLTVAGNPYLLLEYAVGKLDKYIKDNKIENYEDITLPKSNEYISCYAKMFAENEEIAGFRNPHNAPNNILYFKNFKNELMDKYFNFSNNIIAVNLLKNDAQDRGNGFDEDSDFFFCTNNKEVTKCAKNYYKKYETIVNKIEKDKKTYNNKMEDYAKMDNYLMESKNTIGETSNLAQLALSYYWDEKDIEVKKELYNNFIILSVLAQVAIDNSKRKYNVNVAKEIKRIRNMSCMKKSKPYFFLYIKNINITAYVKNFTEKHKNANVNIKCPMNNISYLISSEIKNASTKNTTNITDYVKKIKGKAKKEQMDNIKNIIKENDDFVKENKDMQEDDDEFYKKLRQNIEETQEKLNKFKINKKTLNMLILNAINKKDKTDSKMRDKILNFLYKTNPDKFLEQFIEMKKGEF